MSLSSFPVHILFVCFVSATVAYVPLPPFFARIPTVSSVRGGVEVGLGAWSTVPSLKRKLQSFYIQTTNVTYTEWSIFFDAMVATKEEGQKNVQELHTNYFKLLSDNPENVKILSMKKSNDKDVDKGTSSSIDILREIMDLGGDWQNQLNIFRRNIALRNNRVLHPARNAMIFTSLINTMIADNEWLFARSVVEYIGLTPATYCRIDGVDGDVTFQGKPCIEINLLSITMYVTKKILELDLDRMAWVKAGREGPEPSTPKSRGESVQEWLYTSVLRSDLGFRVCDMLLAVMRLSLRHAVEVRMQQLTTSLPSPTSPPLMPIVIQLSSLDVGLIQSAGIPLDEDYLHRCRVALATDIKLLLPLSFEDHLDESYLENIVIN